LSTPNLDLCGGSFRSSWLPKCACQL